MIGTNEDKEAFERVAALDFPSLWRMAKNLFNINQVPLESIYSTPDIRQMLHPTSLYIFKFANKCAKHIIRDNKKIAD